MELKLVKKTMVVDLYGEKIGLRVPLVRETEQYERDLSNAQSVEEKGTCIRKFIVSLGFPEDKLGEMQNDDYIELITFVLSPKKKSMPQP